MRRRAGRLWEALWNLEAKVRLLKPWTTLCLTVPTSNYWIVLRIQNSVIGRDERPLLSCPFESFKVSSSLKNSFSISHHKHELFRKPPAQMATLVFILFCLAVITIRTGEFSIVWLWYFQRYTVRAWIIQLKQHAPRAFRMMIHCFTFF